MKSQQRKSLMTSIRKETKYEVGRIIQFLENCT